MEAHVEQPLPPNHLRPLQRHDRQLQHLSQEPISPQLLRDAAHHQLMTKGTDQKRDQGTHVSAHVWSAGAINMPPEKMMDRDVPLPAELEPVARVPPVAVEPPIGEAGDLGERAQHILENDEEDEQERDHEREEEKRDALQKDE